MTTQRRCETCGAAFATKSRRARYCSASCRGKAHRARETAPPAPEADGVPVVGPIETAAAVKLDAAPKLDPVTRAALLGVARRLDDPSTPGGAVATLNRELREGFARLDIPAPEPDPVTLARASAAAKLASLPGWAAREAERTGAAS